MKKIETPLVTVDIIIEYQDKIVLIKRKNDPFKGHYALPGGFVDIDETTEAAAIREAKEETGLDIEIDGLVNVYSDRARDPRGHAISVCYFATGTGVLAAGDDAADAELFDINEVPDLAFDHNKMISDAVEVINFEYVDEIKKPHVTHVIYTKSGEELFCYRTIEMMRTLPDGEILRLLVCDVLGASNPGDRDIVTVESENIDYIREFYREEAWNQLMAIAAGGLDMKSEDNSMLYV